MIEPRERVVHCAHTGRIRSRRPPQNNRLNAKRPRGRDLAVGRAATAILRYDEVDLVLRHQCAVIGFAERAARRDVGDMRNRQRRVHRIDAADQIAMLRRAGKRREVVAADGDEHIAAFLSNGLCRRTRVADLDPSVAHYGAPWRPAHRHKWHAEFTRCRGGVLGNHVGIRVSGIDQRINAFRPKIIGQALRATKAADADRHGMRNGRARTPSERQRHVKATALGKPFRQLPGFRRAAEDENLSHAAS